MNPEVIRKTLEGAIPGCQVKVEDLTGTNDHFRVIVVSDQFEGKSLIEQHRMVYAPLEKDIQGAIHALSVKTMTPSQVQK